MTAVTIRSARKSDASEIALLVNIATHGMIARGWAAEDGADDTYDPIEIGRRHMLEDDRFSWRNVLVAEADDVVAGMILCYRTEVDPAEDTSDFPRYLMPIVELEAEAAGTWFISMLGVHADWRNRSIGSRLMDASDARRLEAGVSATSLIVEDVNVDARRLYERRGFAVRASRPMVDFPGGGPGGQQWLLMVKD